MTDQELIARLQPKEIALICIDLLWHVFDLDDCFTALNYSAFFFNVGSDLACHELENQCELSESEQVERLNAFLIKLKNIEL